MPNNMLDGAQVIVDYLIRRRCPTRSACAATATSSSSTRCSSARATSRPSRRTTRASAASWPTCTTACPASRSRPSRPAAPARSTCRSRSPPPISTRCRSWPSPATCRPASSTAARSRSCIASYQADFPSTVRTMCKRVFQPTRGEQVPLMVRQAWKTMVTGRPGPVVLDVPFDVFKEAAAEETPKPRGVERQHLVALRRRSGRRGEGGRHAARGRAAGDPGRPGREVWRAPPTSCSRSPRSCRFRWRIR